MFRYSLLLRQISQSPRRCLSSSLIQSLPPSFIVTQDIQSALANHEPIVALESTIVAHGMPYPTNYQVALAVEDIIRHAGVTPATRFNPNDFCIWFDSICNSLKFGYKK